MSRRASTDRLGARGSPSLPEEPRAWDVMDKDLESQPRTSIRLRKPPRSNKTRRKVFLCPSRSYPLSMPLARGSLGLENTDRKYTQAYTHKGDRVATITSHRHSGTPHKHMYIYEIASNPNSKSEPQGLPAITSKNRTTNQTLRGVNPNQSLHSYPFALAMQVPISCPTNHN